MKKPMTIDQLIDSIINMSFDKDMPEISDLDMAMIIAGEIHKNMAEWPKSAFSILLGCAAHCMRQHAKTADYRDSDGNPLWSIEKTAQMTGLKQHEILSICEQQGIETVSMETLPEAHRVQ